jgi:hypothetical protein
MKRKVVNARQAGTGVRVTIFGRTQARKFEIDQQKKHFFLVGAGSVFDVAGASLDWPKLGSLESDRAALNIDAKALSDDMALVLKRELAAFGN